MIRNITENLGILPINLGPAKLEKTTHTFIHYYNLKALLNQYSSLNTQYSTLKSNISNNSQHFNELENYDKILEFIRTNIDTKINNIRIHSVHHKTKRGLIDGLGSIFKSVTGNLDAEDGKRYNEMFAHLQENEHNLESQIKLSYSVNHQIIQNFNKTISDIQHNEEILKSKILQLFEIIKDTHIQSILYYGKNIYDQLIILYNTILNVLQDVENSITFCKLRTLHPSIIHPMELLAELKQISKFYHLQLPFEPRQENLLDFESLLKINCKIEATQIIYFISTPINFEKTFDLYYMYPIPTKHESKFITIIPNTKYLLKSDKEIVPLNDMCVQAKIFQCPNKYHAHFSAMCEEEIFQNQTSSHCHYTKINLITNHVEVIPEINKYLAVFPNEEKITIKCHEETNIQTLEGIFLINNQNNCEIHFRQQILIFQNENHGQPLLLPKLNLKSQSYKITNFSINLNPLKLNDISFNPIVSIPEEKFNMYIPSIWSIILYAIAAIIVVYFVYKHIKKRKPATQRSSRTPEDVELQLPQDARI